MSLTYVYVKIRFIKMPLQVDSDSVNSSIIIPGDIKQMHLIYEIPKKQQTLYVFSKSVAYFVPEK